MCNTTFLLLSFALSNLGQLYFILNTCKRKDDSILHKHFDSKRTIICTGGTVGEWALAEINDGDYIIGADRGAYFLLEAGIIPDLAVGDFDTVTAEQLTQIRQGAREFRSFDPVDKNYTDTDLAFSIALKRGAEEIVILGGLGTRFDHSLANVHLLLTALKNDTAAVIKDSNNAVRLIGAGQRLQITKDRFKQVSLLPLSLDVKGITLYGFQYPLTDAELTMGQSLGISNLLAHDHEYGTVEISEGLLLVIQSKD